MSKRPYHMSLLAHILGEQGFPEIDEDQTHLLASGPDFHVRASFDRDVMEIAFRRNFDRWANSLSLTFNAPRWWDEDHLRALLDSAKEQCQDDKDTGRKPVGKRAHHHGEGRGQAIGSLPRRR